MTDFIPGTASWNDSSNNKAFLAGQLHLTVNGISIYVTAKKENPQIAEDMNHAHLPAGVDGKTRELHLGFPILVFNFTKYPQACKAFTAFMMEPEQFNPWVEAAQGYLSPFLLGLYQESDLDRRSQEHAVPRRGRDRADAGGCRPDG
jgi:multiple sugar transport system substrate-binding protein